MSPHGRLAYWSREKAALTLNLGLVAGSHYIFTLAVREPPVLTSCIDIYYFRFSLCENFSNWFKKKKDYTLLYTTLKCPPLHMKKRYVWLIFSLVISIRWMRIRRRNFYTPKIQDGGSNLTAFENFPKLWTLIKELDSAIQKNRC